MDKYLEFATVAFFLEAPRLESVSSLIGFFNQADG